MRGKNNKPKYSRQETLTAYLFTVPSFIGFVCFVLIPVIWVFIISFRQYNVFTGASVFVGLDNFKSILSDSRSVSALKNTLWYTILCSVGNTGLGLILAVLVDDILPKKVSVLFRSVYFFPSLVGLTFVAIIWQSFFQTDAGVINYYLNLLGIDKVGWLSNQDFSKVAVLILDMWKNAGISMLLILAGLQNVNRGLLEAAEIDGANAFQRFFKIIIPVASPQIFFVMIMNVTGALRIYESIYVLSGGGPGDSSRSLVMLIAEKGFTSFDYGSASALSMLLLMLIAIVTVVQFVGSIWWVHYE
ncbi:carbohydrate ABC transporter permease [Anaerobium acetethylicum]|uniref:Multiple sugar transport system permease protein n=1 Tax=Anaerobium acetethylicum TaxID=1619234 RepID=A0A1D3TX95_9FIRM|nr:sugar ABC transporter permease [Anaerobium acetethylicum]SCP98919.1 multiple sugar transport system permease protein [Anaerobium acetethylicum]